jgi:hypothetical protein
MALQASILNATSRSCDPCPCYAKLLLDEPGRWDQTPPFESFLCIPTTYMGQALGLLTSPLRRGKVSRADRAPPPPQSGHPLAPSANPGLATRPQRWNITRIRGPSPPHFNAVGFKQMINTRLNVYAGLKTTRQLNPERLYEIQCRCMGSRNEKTCR